MKEQTKSKLRGLSDILRAIGGDNRNRSTAAVIVAAGSGVRMQSETPKQFLKLGGIPVVVRAIQAFCESAYIDRIVCVIRKGDEERYRAFQAKYAFSKPISLVTGGETRQESVLKGVESLKGTHIGYVAIHDGARPLVTPADIDRVCLAAYEYRAATAAWHATDTIKISGKDAFIASTPDRTTVWHATTPQVFEMNLYETAAYKAKEDGFITTDDNALCEHIGVPVKLIDCGKYNLKITEQEDLALAEAMLSLRSKPKE